MLHEGTAIWRYYRGNRFSEDFDVYLDKDRGKINRLFSNLEKARFTQIRQKGSHVFMAKETPEVKIPAVVLIHKESDMGTLLEIIRQSKLS